MIARDLDAVVSSDTCLNLIIEHERTTGHMVSEVPDGDLALSWCDSCDWHVVAS